MEEIGMLLDRVRTIDDGGKPETVFADIAAELFGKWHIRQGGVICRFLEVEFYYYSASHRDCKTPRRGGDGTPVPFVYTRVSDAGDFFLHDSGVDLCFTSRVADSRRREATLLYGGGILLRSLLRCAEGAEPMVVTGPWDCRNALFNYTGASRFPYMEMNGGGKTYDDVAIARARRRKGAARISIDGAYSFYDKSKYKDDNWVYPRYDPVLRTVNTRKYYPRLSERTTE